MIVPKFNKGRLGNANSIGNAIDTLLKPVAKTVDKKIEMNRKAKEKAIKQKEKAVESQDKAAKTYIQETIKAKKGKKLTPAEKRKNIAIRKQNEAAKTYTSYGYDKVSVNVKGSAGRPSSKASQKTVVPKSSKLAKATVNKTAPRKSKPVPKVTATPKVSAPAAPGRRKNGAPK